ncbi:MAG: hypothetical protein ABH867_04360 [Patescibacteria group bacterium]
MKRVVLTQIQAMVALIPTQEMIVALTQIQAMVALTQTQIENLA